VTIHVAQEISYLAKFPYRFGRFLYAAPGNQADQVHLQWFEHGSQKVLGELAQPQELFLTNLCGYHKFDDIAGKATVHFGPQNGPMEGPLDYFCK